MTVNQLKELLNTLPGHSEIFDDEWNPISDIRFEMADDNEGFTFLKMYVRKED